MNMLIKLFLTYTSISMLSALFYLSAIVLGILNPNGAIFVLLWVGPLMTGLSVGLPLFIWKVWKDEFLK